MHRALAALGLVASSLAHASEVRWHCVLSADLTRLHCAAAVPGPVVATTAMAATAAAPQAPVAEVRGTRFPLDPRGTWTVEMWTPPSDGAFVEQLARATICYRSPGCEVTVDLRPLSRQGVR
ncbi:MAG: hypothetical protein JNL85_13990 [Rubrivivax sp.]|nr:hypothetical protein [Rubrivivax sp.]